MKKISLFVMAILWSLAISAQVSLDSGNRDAQYVKTIVGRSQKIVGQLAIRDDAAKESVLHIIANRYFLLNDIHDGYRQEMDRLKQDASVNPSEKKRRQAALQDNRDARLYQHHFEFEAGLSRYLTDSQIEQVKDGLTYGVVGVTYKAYADMIPTLKDTEKVQIMAWLKEAREFAMDAGDSKAKHAWFGKYKGRINNWLSKRGYDLTKERQAWQQRIEARKKN